MKGFFLFGGVLLMLTGVAQTLIKPRDKNKPFLLRWLDRSTLRALLFVCVGVTAVLAGAGYLPLPVMAPPR